MTKVSAGVLLWRIAGGGLLASAPDALGDDDLEVFIVHPGGPFFAHKDEGAWSIPKGEIEPHDDPMETAARELYEETGIVPEAPFDALGVVKQKAGKVVHAFAVDGREALVPKGHRPPQVRIEWPPKSGRELAFDEVDQATWCGLGAARKKLNGAQVELLDRLLDHLRRTLPA